MYLPLIKRRTKFQLMIILFIILVIVPFSYVSLTDASLTIKQEIYDFARGSYDILLRPEKSNTLIEKELALVEENYLGLGNGGITIEEWKDILEREDIEIAAPVASVGLFTAPEITYQLPERQEALRYKVHATTTDGLKEYKLDNGVTAYTIPHEEGINGYATVVDDSLVNVFYPDFPSFYFPTSYHQVVAVDKEQEEALTEMDFSPLNSIGYGIGIGVDDLQEIPIMSIENEKTPVKVTLHLDELKIQENTLENIIRDYNIEDIASLYTFSFRDQALHKDLMDDLNKIDPIKTTEYLLDFSEKIIPFYHNYIFTDDDYQILTYEEKEDKEVELWGTIDGYSQQDSYNLSPVEYIIENGQIKVKIQEVDEKTGIPVYRTLEQVNHYVKNENNAGVKEGQGFYFNHVGNFELQEENESLAASPLGIYGLHKTHLAKDTQTEIYPTAVPGSFISTPAHGIISLEWSELIKGPAPIDAIRIKVAGIEGYNESSAFKIKEIAQEFTDQGYTVDIVAGASHQLLDIDVEGTGVVVQPWTTLGAADTIIKSWDLIKLLLVGFFSVVSLIYLHFSFSNIINENKENEVMLSHLGWSKKHIRTLRYKEWGIMIGIPFLIAFLVLTAYSLLIEKQGYVVPLLCVLLLMLTLLVTVFYASAKKKKRTKVKKGFLPVILQNIWHHKNRVISASFQIIILTFLSTFLTVILQQEKQQTIQTTLGVYVHGEMEAFYIILVAALYTLTIFTIIESLLSLWRLRKDEISLFFKVGWERNKLYLFYLREVVIWSGISIAVGSTLSFIGFNFLIGNVVHQIPLLIIISVSLLVLVIIISSVVLTGVLKENTGYWDRKVEQ
jgi:putative ABC transport system permease protein